MYQVGKRGAEWTKQRPVPEHMRPISYNFSNCSFGSTAPGPPAGQGVLPTPAEMGQIYSKKDRAWSQNTPMSTEGLSGYQEPRTTPRSVCRSAVTLAWRLVGNDMSLWPPDSPPFQAFC